MKNEKILSQLSTYQAMATIEVLERAGVTLEGVNLLRSSPKLAESVARLINNTFLETTSTDRQILSGLDNSNFFGPADWLRYYGIKMDKVGLPMPILKLARILEGDCPFVSGKKVKDTHFLFCSPLNINIREWNKIYPQNKENKVFFGGTLEYPIEDRVPYTLETPMNRWHLIFKGLPKNSFNKDFYEQADKAPFYYYIPKAIDVISMHFLIFEKTREFINPGREMLYGVGVYGRTLSFYNYKNSSKGCHVCVGKFSEEQGLHVYTGQTGSYDARDEAEHSSLGMFYARQLA